MSPDTTCLIGMSLSVTVCVWCVAPRFTSTTFTWVSSFGTVFETGIRLYDTVVVFSQTFVDGANNTEGSTLVCSSFPSFQAGGTPQQLGFLSYSGAMVGWAPTYGQWGKNPVNGGKDGHQDSGPLVLFSADLSLSFVLSAASNFMAASQVCGMCVCVCVCVCVFRALVL